MRHYTYLGLQRADPSGIATMYGDGQWCWSKDRCRHGVEHKAILFLLHGMRRIRVLPPGSDPPCAECVRADRPLWTWDGNETQPTLRKSIACKSAQGVELWHGYLTAGVFEGLPR